MNSKKKALRAVIFRTSHDFDRQLNYKNRSLDLVLIHHTFKNAVVMYCVTFEVLAEQLFV